MLYELAGQYSPDNGNCKMEGETLLLSNSRWDCHGWVVVVPGAVDAAPVDSLVGSDLLGYRQTHLVYIAGKNRLTLIIVDNTNSNQSDPWHDCQTT